MQMSNGAGIVKEVMDHVSPPCERGSQEKTPYYAGRVSPKWAMDAVIIALLGDSPGPWIVALLLRVQQQPTGWHQRQRDALFVCMPGFGDRPLADIIGGFLASGRGLPRAADEAHDGSHHERH